MDVFSKLNGIYRTSNGVQICADSLQVLREIPDDSIDLVLTSPPFALLKTDGAANSRPSGHKLSRSFVRDNGGAIPSNLLQIPNSVSNSFYLKTCRRLKKKPHPARFPEALPEFFIKFLTDPGDIVLDIFSGSNTTGYIAERTGRKWISVELDREYAILSAIRFLEGYSVERIRDILSSIQEEQGHLQAVVLEVEND